MSLDQLDSDGEHPNASVILAHGRVFVLCAVFSKHVRDLILDGDEPVDGDEALKQYARLVNISMDEFLQKGQQPGEGTLSVGMLLKAGFEEEEYELPVCTHIHRDVDLLKMHPAFIRRVFRNLENDSREAIAEYILRDAGPSMRAAFEDQKRYDLASEVESRLERLREQIESGDLPVPPLWPPTLSSDA